MAVWYLRLNAVQGKILSGWVMAGTRCILIKRQVFVAGADMYFVPAIVGLFVFAALIGAVLLLMLRKRP